MGFIKIGKNRFNRDHISVYGEHHGDSSRSFLNIEGAAGDGEFILDLPIAELEAIIFGPDHVPSLPAQPRKTEAEIQRGGRVMDLRELEDAILALDYTGKQVSCEVCFRAKDPRGRSMPMGTSGCNSDCRGYTSKPDPGPLHYGERASEYGFAALPYDQCMELWTIIRGIRERREEAEGE